MANIVHGPHVWLVSTTSVSSSRPPSRFVMKDGIWGKIETDELFSSTFATSTWPNVVFTNTVNNTTGNATTITYSTKI